jgi:hypothetical protein
MSASDIVLRVVPSVAIIALLVWLCCRVEPSGELEEQYFRERRAELESKLIIKRVFEASTRKSTLSQRLTESERAYSSYLSAFPSRSRHGSVRFADVIAEEQQQDETIEEGETQLEEESEHKNEERTTAQVEESSAPKRPHGTASERRTKSSRSHLSWIPSFSSAPSDNVSDSTTLQDPRRRRRKSNILARAISRSFRQSGTSCNICLMDYQIGEEVCWSPNEDCIHAFHKDCILDWLLRTRKCPVCRRDYVP